MNKHVARMVDHLSDDLLYSKVREMIKELLDGAYDDDTMFTYYITVGQFRKIDKFYGSKIVLGELIAAYVGRTLRFYTMENPTAINHIAEILKKVEPAQQRAAEQLNFYFTSKYGQVDKERIEELDNIGRTWQHLAVEQLKAIASGGPFEDRPN